ncbi:MAG: UDP-N-acetylmuramoyl-tripeptide--D-alanyl-D-alanine ligase [bacterium]|nr:UDP-N-acetylmuramoyl-tripeptide--D-alanyl-D-alanine ligase [bacterium]
MISLRFDQLAQMTGGRLQTAGSGERTFAGVSIDSRTLKAGELFIALRGERVDGHNFIAQAIERGAAGLMTELSFQGPALTSDVAIVAVPNSHEAMMSLARQYRDMTSAKVVGITGSNGKTTTKEITYTLLSAVDKDVYRSSGNLNNLFGMPLAIMAMPKETRVAVLEMGISQPGEMTKLTQIVRPDLAVITNIGATHLEFLGSLEGVARAKLEMVASSSPEIPVIINADDPVLTREISMYRDNYITFGITHAATFEPEKIQRQSDGTAIVTIEGHRFRLPLFGEHQVYNLLTGYAVARTLGYGFDAVDTEAIQFVTAPMRGQTVTQRGVTFIVDCYNANPESVRLGLKSFATMETSGRRIIILGDMLELGAQAQEYHRQIGALLAQQPFDLAVGVGPLAKSIIGSAAEGGAPKERLQHFGDASTAAKELVGMFKSGDLVYIKGSRGIGLERVFNEFTGEGAGH